MNDHLRRAEQELVALDILVDGRNARNGYCTWPMISDTVQDLADSLVRRIRAVRGEAYNPIPHGQPHAR